MGLDMYIFGEEPEQPRGTFGSYSEKRGHFMAKELAYWRKHPNLHGYIVQTLANGVDECQHIDLDAVSIREAIGAIQRREMPETEGFFFGKSDSSQDEPSIEALRRVLTWLEAKPGRRVYYQASW